MLRSGPGVHEDHQRDAGTLRPTLSLPTPGWLGFAPSHSRREPERLPVHRPRAPRSPALPSAPLRPEARPSPKASPSSPRRPQLPATPPPSRLLPAAPTPTPPPLLPCKALGGEHRGRPPGPTTPEPLPSLPPGAWNGKGRCTRWTPEPLPAPPPQSDGRSPPPSLLPTSFPSSPCKAGPTRCAFGLPVLLERRLLRGKAGQGRARRASVLRL